MQLIQIVALIALVASTAILFFLVYRFRRFTEPRQRREYTVLDILGAIVGASIAIATIYFSDKYIYQPCGISLSTETVFGRRAPGYGLIVLVVVMGLIVGRIRWLAEHEIWLFVASIAVSGGIIGVSWWRWCT